VQVAASRDESLLGKQRIETREIIGACTDGGNLPVLVALEKVLEASGSVGLAVRGPRMRSKVTRLL